MICEIKEVMVRKAVEQEISLSKSKPRSKGILREYAEAIFIAVLLALFIRAFVVQAYKIPSGSMKPTLLIGDHILVNKFIYGVRMPFTNKVLIPISNPKRGDIIVFKFPMDPKKDFIKRVIGIPGDKIKIVNKVVYVNGHKLKEPYIQHTSPQIIPAGLGPRDNFGPITVPPHSLFVMGDNRDESYDSRWWKFVDYSELRGKAFIIYWSWDSEKFTPRWSRIGHIIH